jgi:Na+/melibiose symporter-like transporter
MRRNLLVTGWASFLTDVSTEMNYPLLQAFVAMILSGRRALLGPVLGIIEGASEATASLLRVFSGYYSDRVRARKAPTIAGYSVSACAKTLLFLASRGWYFVLLSRLFDRAGKGIRTAPRDALISESVPATEQGAAFGFQRAMDFAGATAGVAICYLVSLKLLDSSTGTLRDLGSFYLLFVLSVIPAFAAVCFLFFAQETLPAQGAGGVRTPRPSLDYRRYDRRLKLFFLAHLVFTLGNSSNQFLLLRSMDLGVALPSVILMYMAHNLSSALLSRYLGGLSDRVGRIRILMAGYMLYGIVYGSFGLVTRSGSALLWIFWVLYGIYYAMTEGAEKALVAELAPEESRATALGFFQTLEGVALLVSSVLAGLLFSLSPAAPFLFGAITSVSTAAILTRLRPGPVHAPKS